MRSRVRWQYLSRAPKLVWDILLCGRYEFTYDLMPVLIQGMPPNKRRNLTACGLNLLYRRSKPWSWPIHMQLELTSFCQLRCPVCPTGIGALNRRPRLMDIDLLKRIMAEAGPYLLTASLWGWGEPLLHPRFPEAVRLVREQGVIPLMSTNGQNLNEPRVLDGLMQQPPQYLIVAIDGLCDQTHAEYRKGATLAPILEGVQQLAKMKLTSGAKLPVLHMRYIAMRHNQHELPRVQQFAADHGFDMVSIRSLSVIDADESSHRKLVPDVLSYRAYDYASGVRVRRRDFVCQLICCFPTVLTDGTVIPCDQDFNAKCAYGRVNQHVSLRDIWFGQRAASVRKAIMREPDAFSCCRNCPYADRRLNTCSVELHELT